MHKEELPPLPIKQRLPPGNDRLVSAIILISKTPTSTIYPILANAKLLSPLSQLQNRPDFGMALQQ